MTQRAFYAGSFDPPTLGHLDLIRRASEIFSELVVGIGRNVEKRGLFEAEERIAMFEEEFATNANIRFVVFDGLAVTAARAAKCRILLRGIRNSADFLAEQTMAITNQGLDAEIETLFMSPRPDFIFVSSRLVKEIALAKGPLEDYLSPKISAALKARLAANS